MRSILREWRKALISRPPAHLALLGALASVWIALSPSLLPRRWWMHAINVLMGLVFGYGVGLLLHGLLRWIRDLVDLRISVAPRVAPLLTRLYWAALALITIGVWWVNLWEQDKVARLVGVRSHAGVAATVGLLVGMAVFAAGFAGTRLWPVLVEHLQSYGRRVLHLPARTGRFIAWILVLTLIVVVPNNLLATSLLDGAIGQMAQLNVRTLPDRVAPTVPEKSGGPGSVESWSNLGAQGQAIVSDGPHAADISRWSGKPAKEPIRAYAGLPAGRSIEQAADIVMAELDRTRAWERKNLVVMTSTGTGWIEEFAIAPFEYLSDGDSAVASMQYSYLGSPLAFVLDAQAPRSAGKVLFNKIYDRWKTLPINARPKLYASGYSLGSSGGQAAFSSSDDMLSKLDGALWIGTPSTTPVWRELEAGRQPGSPTIAPVVNNGRHIRFATRPEDLSRTYYGGEFPTWDSPRVVYAQHASDPIVWWNPSLIWSEPDWVRERAGRDVNPDLGWHPWATFWQLSGDMAVSGDATQPHGHRYQEELVPEWAAVLGYDPLSDYTSLQQAIRQRWRQR